jgi:hypothetical protein
MKSYIIIALTCLLISACSSTNRNVIHVAQTGIGVKASYNVETMLPDVWLGFFRSMIFVIPTGVNETNANSSPDILSMIHIDLGLVSGVKIDDKFAIGRASFEPGTTNNGAVARAMFNAPIPN